MQYIHINVYDLNGDTYSYNKEEYGNSLIIELVNERIQEKVEEFINKGLIIANIEKDGE